jgi:hypothetical protein
VATIPDHKVPQLRKLYVEGKYSAPIIAKYFSVPLDAVYYAMRRHNIQRRDPSENNRIQFQNKPLSYKIKQELSWKEQQLKLAGTLVYWSEGYKTEKSAGIDLANSDVDMLKLFIHFLRTICNIDESRLRIYLYCHDKNKIADLIVFWSEQLSIPRNQFTKPYVKKYSKVEKNQKMPYGLVHIRYSDKKLLREILSWIDEYKKGFCVGGRAVKYTSL